MIMSVGCSVSLKSKEPGPKDVVSIWSAAWLELDIIVWLCMALYVRRAPEYLRAKLLKAPTSGLQSMVKICCFAVVYAGM